MRREPRRKKDRSPESEVPDEDIGRYPEDEVPGAELPEDVDDFRYIFLYVMFVLVVYM